MILKLPYALAEDVATRLREDGLMCGAVQVTIRDLQFKTITRQKKPTHLLNEIVEAAIKILKAEWDLDEPIRRLSITGINLVSDNEGKQLSIFNIDDNSKRAKGEKIEQTVDEIIIDTVRIQFL